MNIIKHWLAILGFCLVFGVDGADLPFDRSAPDFVKASLLVFGPGEQLYSCAGHVAFRLECPYFKLDNVFSYEGENASDNVWRFFAGRLKMGMFAIPTAEFLAQYEAAGRGARQYPLELSPAAKVRLWKLFDDLVAKGADLPYDYIKRGCAQSTLQTLLQAICPEPVESGVWPEHYAQSRREILQSYIADAPWTRLLLNMISGPSADFAASPVDKIITPDDLLEYLRRIRVEGRPVLTAAPIELLPHTLSAKSPLVTPLMVAWAVVILALVACFWARRPLGFALWTMYAVLALAETYIVFVSDLPASDWNWLIIPFNPLPLICWHWRRKWGRWAAVLLLGWVMVMALSPHQLTDPSLVVLALAYAVMFASTSGCRRLCCFCR